jgi:hypothetical protein
MIEESKTQEGKAENLEPSTNPNQDLAEQERGQAKAGLVDCWAMAAGMVWVD